MGLGRVEGRAADSKRTRGKTGMTLHRMRRICSGKEFCIPRSVKANTVRILYMVEFRNCGLIWSTLNFRGLIILGTQHRPQWCQ